MLLPVEVTRERGLAWMAPPAGEPPPPHTVASRLAWVKQRPVQGYPEARAPAAVQPVSPRRRSAARRRSPFGGGRIAGPRGPALPVRLVTRYGSARRPNGQPTPMDR